MPRANRYANIVPLDHNGSGSKLTAPSSLSKAARSTFTGIVTANPQQFRQTDVPMLASFAEACVLAHALAVKAARNPALATAWAHAVRGQTLLARSLRLTVQSRVDAKTLGRQKLVPSVLDQFLEEHDADE